MQARDSVCVSWEEVDPVFTRESITEEDPPNVHQAQHKPTLRFEECVAQYVPNL